MYWLVGVFVLVALWLIYYTVLSEGVAMVLHSHLISNDARYVRTGKIICYVISYALYASIAYVVAVLSYFIYQFFK